MSGRFTQRSGTAFAKCRRLGLVVVGLGFLMGGCAYQSAGNQGAGMGIDNPVERKFTWFSYLDAADIRNSCAAGGPDQWRLVYNAQFDKQVRAYDILGGASPVITARARGTSGNLLNLEFDSFEGMFGPWNFRQSQQPLTPAELTELVGLLRQSGFAVSDQSGLRLHSQDFYWLVAGCEKRQFHFNAWAAHASDTKLDRVRFLDFLLRRDATGIVYRKPHAVTYREKRGDSGGSDRNFTGAFTITVHADGINRPGF